jgi:hypothetical protein
VPTDRDGLEEIGRTVLLGEEIVVRKFHAFVSLPETSGDWEEMAWLAGQGVGLIHEIRPAREIVRGHNGPGRSGPFAAVGSVEIVSRPDPVDVSGSAITITHRPARPPAL